MQQYKISTWLSGIHAREWIAASTAFFLIDQLVEAFGYADRSDDPRTHVDYYIMPILNPDGYEYSRNSDRMWRKNRASCTSRLTYLISVTRN